MESKSIDISGITMCLGVLGLTGISGAATTYSSSAVNYTVNGKAYTVTGQAGTAFPTTDELTQHSPAGAQLYAGLTKPNTATVFVVGCDAGDTILSCTQGTIVPIGPEGDIPIPPQFPSFPDDFCPMAYIVAKAGKTFVAPVWRPGSQNWNTTGMTYNVVDIVALPDHPQIS